MIDGDLSGRALRYAERQKLELRDQLGFGVHGNVFVAESQRHPGLSAVKIHRYEAAFLRERDVYFRLREHNVSDVRGAHVPQLLAHDDELWAIEMTIVKKPHVLDFGGAYLDIPPDYPEEVLNEWRTEKKEQFGVHWPEVKRILWALEKYGIFMADVTPNNISICD